MLQEWQRFINALPPAGSVPAVILESWERSRAFGIDTEIAHHRRVSLPELQSRLATEAALVRAAQEPMERATASLANVRPHVVILTDRDGVVLHSVGSDPALTAEFGLIPGFDWSERVMGTNGIGTALAAAQPVVVLGPQHYSRAWHNNTCVGAPVRAPGGAVVGVIDVSTSAADGDPARLVLVREIVAAIEHELAASSARTA